MKNQFIVDQLKRLDTPTFTSLCDFAFPSKSSIEDMKRFNRMEKCVILAQAIVDDEDIAEQAMEYIDIGM